MISCPQRLLFCLIFFVTLSTSCTMPTPVTRPRGIPTQYGEERHPGIDYEIPRGAPIIAVSDGEVVVTRIVYVTKKDKTYEFRSEDKRSHEVVPIRQPSDCEGYGVMIQHGDHFTSFYMHLSTFVVDVGQKVKRGQLIGLSGASFDGWQHLHFGLVKIGGQASKYSETYEPKDFWLGGKPGCFDPKQDYSKFSEKEITHPIACGEYARSLRRTR
jgi:murein DD-endopeptidase MepM/ murein hydrolase activator NlpD